MAGILDRLDSTGEDGGFSPKQQALFALAGMLAQASERGARTGAGLTGAVAGAAGQYQQAVDVKRENRRAQVKDEISKALLEKQQIENESEKRRRDMLAGILGDISGGADAGGAPRGGLLGKLTDDQRQALAILPPDDQARFIAQSAFPGKTSGRVVNLPIGDRLVPHVFDPATGEATPIPGTGGPRFAPQGAGSSAAYQVKEVFDQSTGRNILAAYNPNTNSWERVEGYSPPQRYYENEFGVLMEKPFGGPAGSVAAHGAQPSGQPLAASQPGAGQQIADAAEPPDAAQGTGISKTLSRGATEAFSQAGIGKLEAEEIANIQSKEQLDLVKLYAADAFGLSGRANVAEMKLIENLTPEALLQSPQTAAVVLRQLKIAADQNAAEADAMAKRLDMTGAQRGKQVQIAQKFRKLSAAISVPRTQGGGSIRKQADDAASKYLGK